MNTVRNPYAPGAGTQPPELSGRDAIREQVRVALERLRIGRHSKSIIMVGLRGVGKTVLLERIRSDAESAGAFTIRAETPENRSLPALLAPQLRTVLVRLSAIAKATALAQRGLRALAGFVKAFRVKFHDIEVVLDLPSEPGLADNGELEGDLGVLLEQVGLAARAADTVVLICLDEIQYIDPAHFAALIAALHRCRQINLPITMVGAGLPQLRSIAGDAKSYAERLFDFPIIGPLDQFDSRTAITKPAKEEGVDFTPDSVASIIDKTQGYPYFLQEWGKHCWDIAQQSPITAEDVRLASIQATAALDESFFRVRLDRLTPREKKYLRAMADLGPGPHRSGDIAVHLGKPVSTFAMLRQSLIKKGMVWSPNHGDTAFTVPLFDEFMKRIMPELE